MKNKLLCIGFVIALQTTSVTAMDGCYDQRNLESTAKRYTLTIKDGGKINEQGIVNDLQFLSPDALSNPNFSNYVREDSFQTIASQATTENQQQVVETFAKALEFENVKTDLLLKTQLSILLHRIIENLRPSYPSSIYDNPMLKSLTENSVSKKCGKMLLPGLIGGPID